MDIEHGKWLTIMYEKATYKKMRALDWLGVYSTIDNCKKKGET